MRILPGAHRQGCGPGRLMVAERTRVGIDDSAIPESTPPSPIRGRPGRGASARRCLESCSSRSWDRSRQEGTVRRLTRSDSATGSTVSPSSSRSSAWARHRSSATGSWEARDSNSERRRGERMRGAIDPPAIRSGSPTAHWNGAKTSGHPEFPRGALRRGRETSQSGGRSGEMRVLMQSEDPTSTRTSTRTRRKPRIPGPLSSGDTRLRFALKITLRISSDRLSDNFVL
jgi:hypothetical protein